MTSIAEASILLPPLPGADLSQWAEWLFRFGCDTIEIAKILDVPEADAERALHEGQEAFR